MNPKYGVSVVLPLINEVVIWRYISDETAVHDIRCQVLIYLLVVLTDVEDFEGIASFL